jgi:hypothetical protein
LVIYFHTQWITNSLDEGIDDLTNVVDLNCFVGLADRFEIWVTERESTSFVFLEELFCKLSFATIKQRISYDPISRTFKYSEYFSAHWLSFVILNNITIDVLLVHLSWCYYLGTFNEWIIELAILVKFNASEDFAVEVVIGVEFYDTLLGVLLVKLLGGDWNGDGGEFGVGKQAECVGFSEGEEGIVVSIDF